MNTKSSRYVLLKLKERLCFLRIGDFNGKIMATGSFAGILKVDLPFLVVNYF